MKHELYKSTCSYCGVGCGIIVEKDSRGKLSVRGDEEHPVNMGMLCSKGLTLNHVVQNQSDRLLYPQMRWNRNYPMQRVDWETAIQRAAAVFSTIIEKHGPESVAFYVSGQCTTEEYYLVNKLVKGYIGSNNIDTNSRLCMSSAVAAYKKVLGEDAVPICYEDIELADCFFITGANPAWCHPILFRRLEKHKAKNPRTKVIVVDPRKTQTASLADLHLQINPGSDVYLHQIIARIIYESGNYDKKFVNIYTEAFEPFIQQIKRTTLEEAVEKCGITAEEIQEAAGIIQKSNRFMSMYAMGLNQSSVGVNKNVSLINIHLLTGQIGKPGAGPFSLTGQPNAMGGREVGGMANLLAVHKNLANETHRQEVADFWGVEAISPKVGMTATQIFENLKKGTLKAVWIICTNPVVSLPNSRLVEEGLENAKFVVVQDISNKSATVPFADLVLPAAGWGEKVGTMTNSERRISYLPKFAEPPGEAKPDAEILWQFAAAMNYPGFQYTNVSEVYDEYCRMTKGTNIDIAGLSHERLKNEGTMQWPVPHPDHKGTKRLFEDNMYYTPSRKAKFQLFTAIENQSEAVTTDYPLILNTGRIRDQWHTMTRTGKVNKLKRHIPKATVEISSADAEARGLKDGDLSIVRNKRGETRLQIKVSDTVKPGNVFLPMHWGKIGTSDLMRANNLTQNLLDPISKQPDFKFSAVQIEKFVKPKQRICIVGAGAAAFAFVQEYRKKNNIDEIIVFSKEKNAFYNRILLPEYLTGHKSWEVLKKYKDNELNKLNIRILEETAIEEIDREKKICITEKGEKQAYDILILATGSRPFMPREVDTSIQGIFTLRQREDADRLKAYLDDTRHTMGQPHALIIGGGLLGLETAAALKGYDVKVAIVQRASRLMERQLDIDASNLLMEEMQDRNISIYFNNEVQTVQATDDTSMLNVTLKSGKRLYCNAVLYAIGTRPNIEIAQKAGIDIRRGAVVNDRMRTNDPSIFAIGEIAEHKGQLYGITSAAEKQAALLANYIAGDNLSVFEGTILMNVLKVDNLNLCSIGKINVAENNEEYEQVIFKDITQRYYKKCIIHQDRLVGAILVGDKSEFGEFKRLIEEGIELSEKRGELLRPKIDKKEVLGNIICSCNEVGIGNIQNACKKGLLTLEEICKNTAAGTACGSCKPEIQLIINNEKIMIEEEKAKQLEEEVPQKTNGKKRNLLFKNLLEKFTK